jgi:hypothetical protein
MSDCMKSFMGRKAMLDRTLLPSPNLHDGQQFTRR